MKKLIVIGAVTLAAAVSASAQQFSAKNLGVAGAGSVFSPDGVTKAPTTTDIAIIYNGNVVASGHLAIAGTFALGTVTLAGAGATATVTVDVWDSTTGATYAAATTKATEDVSVALAVAPTPPGGMGNFKSLTLVNTSTLSPEPSTYALGALGLGGLLLISRRRK